MSIDPKKHEAARMARRAENLPTGGDDAMWAEVGGVLRKHGYDPALLIASLATKKDGKIVCVTADRATGSSGCPRTVAEAIELGYAHDRGHQWCHFYGWILDDRCANGDQARRARGVP
jgi:hypothetical protein